MNLKHYLSLYCLSAVKSLSVIIICVLLFSSCGDAVEKTTASGKPQQAAQAEKPQRKKVILFFGNSITAAYGLSINDAFTTMIQTRLDSSGFNYEVINAGVSGETTASGTSRVNWVVERQPVDIFVLELGANDGLRGLPVKETKKNLEKIIDLVRKAHPDVKIILAGMMIPPSMGAEYSNAFSKIFPEIASSKNATLIPFILENVAGIDTLNQADGIHPNEAGEKIVFENVWTVLKEHVASDK